MRRRAAVAAGLALAAFAGAAQAQPPTGGPMPADSIPASRALLIAGVEVAAIVAAIVAGVARAERRTGDPGAPAQAPADEPAIQPEVPPEGERKRPAL